MRIFFFFVFIIFSCSKKNESPGELDQKVQRILSQMTLEEKVGQMTQINLTVIAKGPNKWKSKFPLEINLKRAKKALIDYKVGSVLNTINNTALSPEVWYKTISLIQKYAIDSTRLKIPVIYGIDAVHGTTYTDGATMFPHQITTAASWNPENAYNMAMVCAYETRASGIPWNFSPVLDLDQNSSSIIGDRAFSDQIDIVIDCARAFIYGMNEAGMACVGKHFPGHGSISEDSHIEKPIDQRTLNEIENKDLIPFKELINNLDGIMTAHILFSEVDTSIATFSKVWIKQILKEQMKFEGMIFSDDLSMEGTNEFISFYDKTKNAINSGCEMILICNNREGVKDALKYLHDRQPSLCHRDVKSLNF